MPESSGESSGESRLPSGSSATEAHQAAAIVPAKGNEGSGGDLPRSAWPESWFHPPRTASQLGLTTYKQSPMLDAAVASGALPPVEERLPEDPIVIEPYESIGVHGGTASVFEGGVTLLNPPGGAFRVGPQLQLNKPNYVESGEFSDGGRTLTIQLRPGVKWSDGHPLTSDDFEFDLIHIEFNSQLTPVVTPMLQGASIEKHGPYRFSFHFAEPQPLFLKKLAHTGYNYVAPAHFMKRYHPAFIDEAELTHIADSLGVEDWRKLFEVVNNVNDLLVFHTPVMSPFMVIDKSSTRSRFERNPYYPFVDPAGNQLPYIDYLETQKVESAEIKAAKASTGQITFSGRQFVTADIALFKSFEGENGYTTYIWPRPYGSDVVFQFNLTHPNERLRTVFQDVRFRRAMSMAIDRDEINDIVYMGKAVPRQLTVVPSSRYFEPEFARAYADFDTAAANRLFDEIGLVDVTGDGIREGTDGEALSFTLEYTLGETPKQETVELVTAQWREVGMQVNRKQISAALQATRVNAGLMDMSIWHADRNADILFPIEPFWYVPMHVGQEPLLFSRWARWYLSRGTKGLEPPANVKQLIQWWEVLRQTPDLEERIEMGKNILRSQAENVWSIGVLGLGPHPVVVKNSLKNVPRDGYWGWDSWWAWPYHPETWYLDPGTN
ncbi:MAG: ABC transporter substrate-binding protein [Gemmatimonadetes bacterium]|nr:ABC transporter substrate-binding protein [Gemmatimonadota bacterium]